MKLKPPKPDRRVLVTARDVDSGKSKSFTVYEATPDEVIDQLKQSIEDADPTDESDGANSTEESPSTRSRATRPSPAMKGRREQNPTAECG